MAPFKIDIKDAVLIKPSKPTPSSVLILSTLDNIPESNGLCQTIHVYQSQNHDSPNDNKGRLLLDPANLIKEALSKALFYYYPLAGKLVKYADGKLRINCNAEGVPFIEAIANCNLSSLHNYLDGSDTSIATHLAFDLPSQDDENGIGNYQLYPLGFKLTKFQCGGFTIGMGLSHSVCDGCGASQFLKAIIELASRKVEPSVKPVWERERLIGSITKQPLPSLMDNASAAVSPFLPTTTLIHECFKVDTESIRRLKLSLMKELLGGDINIENMKENSMITSFESLAAYVWRSRARALKLSYDGKTMLTVTVGIRRHLLDAPLPEGYYGNAIVDADVVLTVKELNERPLSQVVQHIREKKNVAFTRDYIIRSMDTFETEAEDFDVEGTGAFMTLTDWKHLGFLEGMDFGRNVLVNAMPAPCNLFGSVGCCIFAPPSKLDSSMKGGVRIFVSLPSSAMPKFREEMEALRLIVPWEGN